MTTDRLAESTVVFRSGEREKTEREVRLAEVREKRACRKLSKPCAQQGYPVAWSTVVLRDSRIRRLLPEHSRDSLRHERYALSFDEQQRVQIETDVAPDVGRHAT